MVIKIEPPKQDGYNPTLKLSRLLPAEFVELSKFEYETPREGSSQLKEGGTTKTVPWHMYQVAVHKFKTVKDLKTLEIDEQTFEDGKICSMFANKTVHEGLENLPLNVRVRITAVTETGPKGDYTKYVVEPIDKVEDGTTSATTNTDVSLDDKIRGLKAGGASSDDVVKILHAQYDVSEDFIKSRYEVL